MNSRSKYLFKNVGILTISNFASKILVFLLVPLYTDILSTEEVGVFDLAVSTVTLLFPILTLNIVDAIMRFSMDKAKSKKDIIAIGIRFVALSWLIGGVIVVALKLTGLVPKIAGFELLIYLYFVFYIFYQLLLQFSKGLERVTDMGVAGVISTVAMIGGNILFLLVFRIGLHGFFLANVLAQILPTVYLFFRLKFWQYLKNFKIDKALQKEMLLYCMPLIATTLGWWVNNTSDKYVVAFMVSVSASGLLAVSYKIPQIINTLQGIFIQAWQISAIKEYEGKDKSEFYGKAFTLINVLMCAACAWLIILTKPLGFLLYKKEFFEAWQFVPFLLVSCVLNSASGFLGPILSAKKDSKSMAMSAVYGATANLILNIALVFLIGVQGATIATVISASIIYIVRKRAVGKDIAISRYSIVIVTWVLLCVQAALEIYTTFWWAEAILMALMLVLNEKDLIETVNVGKGILSKRKKKDENSSDNAD